MSGLTGPQANVMKARMTAGGLAVGMIVRVTRGVEIAAIARSAGFDSLYVDLEHCSFSLDVVSQIAIAATALGVTPLVRTPTLDATEIGRILDVGAQGVIAPHIESRLQAEALVDAALFPPLGRRAFFGAHAHTLFAPADAKATMPKLNEATLVVAMIESVVALDKVEDIASVPGLDMLLVGANDLSASMGLTGQPDHERMREAFAHVGAVCQNRGLHLGLGGLSGKPDFVRELVAGGARYVSAGSDAGFLYSAAVATAGAYR
jgi:2-keto-3-deoxy-L-rhamnonate aldolase RhmA